MLGLMLSCLKAAADGQGTCAWLRWTAHPAAQQAFADGGQKPADAASFNPLHFLHQHGDPVLTSAHVSQPLVWRRAAKVPGPAGGGLPALAARRGAG